MIICVAVICTKKKISGPLISPNKSPVDMLDHDVVRRTSVPVSKFRTTTIALFYVAWQCNELVPVRGIS